MLSYVNGHDRESIRRDLERACPKGIRFDESMARHTTIGAGGKARFFAIPNGLPEIVSLVRTALKWKIDYLGIGKGSNLLVRDGGFNGLLLKIAGSVGNLRIYQRTAHAEAGLSFTRLSRVLTREGRAGFEFAAGIPGSVGGAVRMNAGAFGSDLAGVLKSVKIVDNNGRVIVLTRDELGFGYRTSHLPPRSIVLSAIFNCPPGIVDDQKVIQAKSRSKTQPISERNFGSTFKNPPGGFAAKMIEECGLKGTRRRGVMVSEKHANFLVNVGEDTKANDIEDLISFVKEEVKAHFNVTLSLEVIVIGDR